MYFMLFLRFLVLSRLFYRRMGGKSRDVSRFSFRKALRFFRSSPKRNIFAAGPKKVLSGREKYDIVCEANISLFGPAEKSPAAPPPRYKEM